MNKAQRNAQANLGLNLLGPRGEHITPNYPVIIIGIDPGVNTGFAIYDRGVKSLTSVWTFSAWQTWDYIMSYIEHKGVMVFVRWEDCRLRKWKGKAGRERLKGVGSIERDCSLWQEFFERRGIANEPVAPKTGTTKIDAERFKALTGWSGKSSEHSRDAAMLVYGY